MNHVKGNIIRAIAYVSLGFLLGYIVAYVFSQYQFERFMYSSLVRNVKLYEETIDLLGTDNQKAARQRMIESLEKDTSTLSGCLNGFCADGRNEYYRQVYESSSKKLQKLKGSAHE